MGWRGTLRSLGAAARRAERARARVERLQTRQAAKIHRSTEAVLAKARRLDEALQRDPIKALGLRWTSGTLTSTPFEIHTELFRGTLNCTTSSAGGSAQFEPRRFASGSAFVEPLELSMMVWGVLVVVRVGHSDPAARPRLDWVNRRNPSSSRIYLVDPTHNEYYFPKASDLTGDVVPNIPREGLVVFEPLRVATDRLELHLADVRLAGLELSTRFAYLDASLPASFERHRSAPSIEAQARQAIESALAQRAEARSPSRVGKAILWGLLIVLAALVWGAIGGKPDKEKPTATVSPASPTPLPATGTPSRAPRQDAARRGQAPRTQTARPQGGR